MGHALARQEERVVLETTVVSRTVGEASLVDELRMVFTHTNRMDWFSRALRPRTGGSKSYSSP